RPRVADWPAAGGSAGGELSTFRFAELRIVLRTRDPAEPISRASMSMSDGVKQCERSCQFSVIDQVGKASDRDPTICSVTRAADILPQALGQLLPLIARQ